MQKQKVSRLHTLSLTYADYLKSGRTIANSRIGKYFVYDQLGRGAFGAVYKGMDDESKKTVAIKVLDLQAVEKEPNERIKQIRRRLCVSQSQLMMLCDSPNIVKCYDVYENRSLKIIVMQYCNGGDLQQQIMDNTRIPQKQAILIMKQLINGIAQMHTHNIIHRDLKAENILSHNGVYKIADLGFSKQVGNEEVKQTTLGTITTMAPEVMRKEAYGLKADIWSVGIIFFQMIFGKVPYTSTNATQMYSEIQTKKILDTEQFQFNNYKASKNVTTFLREIVMIDKAKRLGWKELTKHPIFDIGDDRLDNEFRLNYALNIPKRNINDEIENDQIVNPNNVQNPDFLPVSPDKNGHTVIRMTQAETNLKKKELRDYQDELYGWVKETHLECLKTQLIYNQIFQVIKVNNILDIGQRQVVQFIYLILTRCLNNISVINSKIQNEKGVPILTNLLENVKRLYDKIVLAWSSYSKLLTEFENKVGSIISDRFMKIFKSKSIQTKDKFLTGVEKIQYTKQQQIRFTDEEYISGIKGEIKGQPVAISKRLKNYLSHYVQINSIRLSDLKQRTFEEYVQMILQ